MLEVELFFAAYKNTAYAIFSGTAFIYALIRIADWFLNRYKLAVEERQRQAHQATFFDLQEARYTELLDKYVALELKYCKLAYMIKTKAFQE